MFSSEVESRRVHENDYRHRLQSSWNDHRRQDDGDEDEDEPAHALDLRIGKADESITIFDDADILTPNRNEGPDRIRRKHLSDRYCPYNNNKGRSPLPTPSCCSDKKEESGQDLRAQPLQPESDCDSKLVKESNWFSSLKYYPSNSRRYTANESPRANNERLTEAPAAAPRSNSFASSVQPHPCNEPAFSQQKFYNGFGYSNHQQPTSDYSFHGIPRNQVANKMPEWPQIKTESPSPLLHQYPDKRSYIPQVPLLPHANHPHPFNPPYLLPGFPGPDFMRARSFFHPHHRSQLLMAAAAHHHHQQQQHQQQQQQLQLQQQRQQQIRHHERLHQFQRHGEEYQYKMNADLLRSKLMAMQSGDSDCSNRKTDNFLQRAGGMMKEPPPLVPFDRSTVIKEEPVTSASCFETPVRTRRNSSNQPSALPCPSPRAKDDADGLKSDRFTSTFLWHVLQKHSGSKSIDQDKYGFSEIDDRLKSIEEASGLYNSTPPDDLPNLTQTHIKKHQIFGKRRSSVGVTSSQYRPCATPSPSKSAAFPSDDFIRSKNNFSSSLAEIKTEAEAVDEDTIETNFNLMPRYTSGSLLKEKRELMSPVSCVATSPYSLPTDESSFLSPSDINAANGKRGRPRKHAPKVPLPPIYIFIRNLLHNSFYNPRVVSWVNEYSGVFRVNNTTDFARTWGLMKSNRGVKMNYEKLSRAMRYHYGSTKQGRKGHLAMVKEKRLFYRFGELAVNWKRNEVHVTRCDKHDLCMQSLCLWTKE